MINLTVGIIIFIIIYIDYFIMKPLNKDCGLRYRLISTILAIINILMYFY